MGNIERSTYKIVRFFYDPIKPKKVIMEGLTLREAQEHCNSPNTKKDGEWFDGYYKEE